MFGEEFLNEEMFEDRISSGEILRKEDYISKLCEKLEEKYGKPVTRDSYTDELIVTYSNKPIEDGEYFINARLNYFLYCLEPDFDQSVKSITDRVDKVIETGKLELKEKIVLELINTNEHQKMLEKIPHRDIFDMSVIYSIDNSTEYESYRTVMTNDIAENTGLAEEQLYEIALQNTIKKYPVILKTYEEMFGIRLEELYGLPVDEMDTEETPLILTTQKAYYGSYALLDKNKLKSISEKLDDNYYIIPSSKHELLIVSKKSIEEDHTDEFAIETFRLLDSNIAGDDTLSRNLYLYNREKEEIECIEKSKYCVDIPSFNNPTVLMNL